MQPHVFSGRPSRCLWALPIYTFLYLAYPITALAETSSTGATRDFVEYWSAARIFLDGGNPYSPEELLALQRTAGWGGVQALPMWNPPWTLLLILPFGMLSFSVGQLLWLLLHVCILLISAQFLWRIYADPGLPLRIPWVLTLTFVPSVFVLIIGQITPLVVAAMTWFVYAERRQNYWAMSAALIVLSIKPHVLYLFWVVLVLWMLDKRLWRLIVSVIAVGVTAALLPLVFDREIYSEYFTLYHAPGVLKPLEWPAPTLRNVLRILFDVEQRWVHFAPTAIAIAWAGYYWLHHRIGWRWREHIPLLSLVSIASSGFVWTYDHVVVLPAIMESAAQIFSSSTPWYRYWAARLYLAINLFHGILRLWVAEELHYFWLAPSLLIVYLIFLWERNRQEPTMPV